MSINSMSGYGKGISESENFTITVEIKSVNHRFLDLSIRSPKQLNFADEIIKNFLKKKGISRGHLDIYIQLETKNQEEVLKLDNQILDKYINFIKEIEIENKLKNIKTVINYTDILKLDGVITKDTNTLDDKELKKVLLKALDKSIKSLIKMRQKEGEKLVSDIKEKLHFIDDIVLKIEKYSKDFNNNYKQKLMDKIKEYLNIDADIDRINQEVVIYADKVCIDEEITRLKSHSYQCKKILDTENSPIGKKIDFLIQETNRESNTTAAKCLNLEVSNLIIELKTTIEKIREQIQNIE